MNHPPPETFPDPMQRIGHPITPAPGTEPNPAYQQLLTLYAKVYGAEEGLTKALRPACRTARDDHAWIGDAARKWVSELEDWNKRLDHATSQILQELAERLRETPPYVPVGSHPMEHGVNPGGPYQGVNPGGLYHGENPGGPYHPGPGVNPGGPNRGENPGGPYHPGHDENPGGPYRNDSYTNPGGPYQS